MAASDFADAVYFYENHGGEIFDLICLNADGDSKKNKNCKTGVKYMDTRYFDWSRDKPSNLIEYIYNWFTK
jgi:hypothetical protein